MVIFTCSDQSSRFGGEPACAALAPYSLEPLSDGTADRDGHRLSDQGGQLADYSFRRRVFDAYRHISVL
jgi:hypothetical protein